MLSGTVTAWLTALLLLSLLLYHLFHADTANKKKPEKEGKGDLPPSRWPLVGMLPSFFVHVFKGDAHDWVAGVLSRCGGTFAFIGPTRRTSSIVTGDPANVEYILNTRFSSFPKGPSFRSAFRELLGDGILNADGNIWELQRKTAAYHFNSSAGLSRAVESVRHVIYGKLLPFLDTKAGENFDLQDVLLRFSFDSVCHMAFHSETGVKGRRFADAFETASKATAFKFLTPKILRRGLKSLGKGIDPLMISSLRIMDDFLYSITGSTERSEHHLLAAFKDIKDTKFLRDVCMNFILAGRDTTSVALTWFFWLLLRHQHVEERILQEIRDIIKARPKEFTGFEKEELKRMKYLEACLSESMRLYPPVPLERKQAGNDEVLPSGMHVKKDDIVYMSVYSVGRMRSVWGEDCNEFRPERWLDKKGEFLRHSAYKYPVFNGGPRLCLGKEFAYLQMKHVVASVLTRFRIVWRGTRTVESARAQVGVTLYMKGGLPVSLVARTSVLD